ncbi:MAG: hypothetical protein CVV33_03710 [Methanomicrobiales archaeon HGW-Methanomicrobiales-4]|nr:MAG: hypothetical protein CVV33_03710 [Methanomicrobiales archaeon HGW-Methanomicrobiales-4]
MPESSRGSPATPIIIGIVMVIIIFILLLIFIGVIPYEAIQGGKIDSKNLDASVKQSELQAMKNSDNTEALYPNESKIPAKPDPILSSLEQPFAAEEEQEER